MLRQLVPIGILAWAGHDQGNRAIHIEWFHQGFHLRLAWSWIWGTSSPPDNLIMGLMFVVPSDPGTVPQWTIRRGSVQRRTRGCLEYDLRDVVAVAPTPAALPRDALATLRQFVAQPRTRR